MPTPLSDTQIQRIAAAVEEGRPQRVYFTAEAVGMQEGRSGTVVALASPAEPDYVHVRPSGSNDTLAFSPSELTLTPPPRRRVGAQRPRTEAENPDLFDGQ
ncbi:hypothetical protein ACFVMC_30430 [Nocardia sp. NPDC127579]|uniref:hypothetical protein n=1 Tax=Nocardia sp. NPDC127579 TaxID=3345402 RepID=UPI00362DA24D